MSEGSSIALTALAILILVGVPVAIFFGVEVLTRRFDESLREIRRQGIQPSLAERREHRRKVRLLKHQTGTPIERHGADLRRLRQLIQASERSSATQQSALRQAYDTVLIETCTMLELSHELDRPTVGTERDIERVRVEAMLEGHGIVLNFSRRHDQNA